jgi:hypothetical protein
MPVSTLKLSLCLVFCATTFSATAQNSVLIPYRKGNLWGLVDTLGQFVLPPKYQQCQFIEDSFWGLQTETRSGFVIQSDNLFGFYTSHEVVPPRFTTLKFSSPHYIEGIQSADKIEYFLNSGKRAVPLGWLIKSTLYSAYFETKDGSKRSLFLECQTPDQLRSLYVLTIDQPELAQELIIGCSNIEFTERRNNQVHVEVKRPNVNYEELLTFEYDIDKKKWVSSNPKRPVPQNKGFIESTDSEAEMDESVPYPHYGTAEAPAEEVEYPSSSYLGAGVGSRPPITATTSRFSANYSIKNDSLFVRFSQNGKLNVTRHHIPLPPEAKNLKVSPYNAGITNVWQRNDSSVTYSNFIQYRLNNKQVVQCFYGHSAMAFDTLVRFPVAGASRDVFFLAGERDELGNWKMGLINDSGAIALPIEYAHIEMNLWLGPKDVYHPEFRLMVQKNGVYGFTGLGLNPTLEGNYDAVNVVRPNDQSTRFFSLRKGENYGVALFTSDGYIRKPLRIEPKFPFPVSSISKNRGRFQYPFYLMKCTDAQGQFMGFIDSRARIYFEN